jgi:hypothetical protein
LGLTRPFQKSDADQKWCYIQVTGIYTFPDYLEGKCFADFNPLKPAHAAPKILPPANDYRREGYDNRKPEFSEIPEDW